VSRQLAAENDLYFLFRVGTCGPHYVKRAGGCTHV
jgi:hypothetical protein